MSKLDKLDKLEETAPIRRCFFLLLTPQPVFRLAFLSHINRELMLKGRDKGY